MITKNKTRIKNQGACVLIVFISVVINCVCGIDYCGAKLCKGFEEHTFCQYDIGPGHSCINYRASSLSRRERLNILQRLNRRRSQVARGLLRGLPGSANMRKLWWSEDLARLAQRWVDQCRPIAPTLGPEEHDSCRDLYFTTVGQCVSTLVGEAPGLLVETLVDTWYIQSRYYKGSVTNYVIPKNNSIYYGDFAQMLYSESYMVGCARSKFDAKWKNQMQSVVRLVCNFGPRGPSQGEAIWKPGPPAADCSDSVDETVSSSSPDLEGLCDNRMFTNTFRDSVSLDNQTLLMNNENQFYHDNLDEAYLSKLEKSKSKQIKIQNGEIKQRDYNLSENNMTNTDISVNFVNNNLKDNVIIKILKRKSNVVGRPRPYDWKEFNDIGIDQAKENLDDMSDEKLMNEKYNFEEYELSERQTYPVTNSTSIEKPNENADKNDADHSNKRSDTGITNTLHILNSDTVITEQSNTESLYEYNENDTYMFNDEKEFKDDFHRKEHVLAKADINGKVRRKMMRVHNSYKGKGYYNFTLTPMKKSRLSLEKERKEKGKEFEPVGKIDLIDSVMNYVPYLRQYKNNLRSHAGYNTANASGLTILIIYVYSYLLNLFLYFFISK